MRVRPTLYPLAVAMLAGGLLLGCAKKQEEPGATSQLPTPTAKVSETEKTGGETVGEEQVQYTCPMHPEVKQAGPGKCPKCGMELVEAKGKQPKPNVAAGKVAAPSPTGASRLPAAVYYCPMHPEVTSEKPGKCPKCGMNLVEAEGKQPKPNVAAGKVATSPATQATEARTAEKIYLCPMHPNVISDKPGKCPKCGMDLEEGVYACEMCGVYENKPGKCPKCGMELELIPKSEQERASSAGHTGHH